MKFQAFVILATLCAITVFSSCKSDGAAGKDAAQTAPDAVTGSTAADPAAPQLVDPLAATPPPPTTKEPAQNAAGVWHYTCPKGCAGGGGAPTACAKCGTTLTHNQAYHGTTPSTAATPANKTATPTTTTTPAPTPEPAQNKSGVWHYTCPGGCAGGGASASACAKCGKALAHNQAYHQ